MNWLLDRRRLPLALLLIGILSAALLLATRPRVEVSPKPTRPPLVRARTVESAALRLPVTTHGTVAPRTESELVPEVSGTIISVSPHLVSGGFFEKGEVLVEIDPRDYEAAVERAAAALVRAESQYESARRTLERQRALGREEAASASEIDDAEEGWQVATAGRREAVANVEQARRDLERTRLRAPFDGRVRDEKVGVGQFIGRGTPVASLYATDYVEIRLPISDRQLAFLDLPLGPAPDAEGPSVVLSANFAGREHRWPGRVHRTEGEIDPRTRMVHVVARIENPYLTESDRPPLAVGLFVRAEIEGRLLPEAVVLPRAALDGRNLIWTIDPQGRLHATEVEVIRVERDRVVIDSGLAPGDRVVISPLEAPRDGLLVEVDTADTVTPPDETALLGESLRAPREGTP